LEVGAGRASEAANEFALKKAIGPRVAPLDLGQLLAAAAVEAVEGGVSVQDVAYPRLRKRLIDAKQILTD
jgi:hypothetical protein